MLWTKKWNPKWNARGRRVSAFLAEMRQFQRDSRARHLLAREER